MTAPGEKMRQKGQGAFSEASTAEVPFQVIMWGSSNGMVGGSINSWGPLPLAPLWYYLWSRLSGFKQCFYEFHFSTALMCCIVLLVCFMHGNFVFQLFLPFC